MSLLLSIDPGKRHCGCALWRDGWLVRAELVHAEMDSLEIDEQDLALCVDKMAFGVVSWASLLGINSRNKRELQVICEYPQTYGGRAARGDANDLIDLAVVVGSIIATLGAPATLCRPSEWKGNLPKPETKADYVRDGYIVERRARAPLSSEEQERWIAPRAWKLTMDVSDATGIGLWHLKTTGVRR